MGKTENNNSLPFKNIKLYRFLEKFCFHFLNLCALQGLGFVLYSNKQLLKNF